MRAPLKRIGALLKRLDARWFQIAFLASFLLFGALARDFALSLTQVAGCFASGLATQALWQWGLRLAGRKSAAAFLSPIVTCFGICILVRAENSWIHPLLACLAMSSKYVLRAGPAACKSHILNPANLAACAAVAGAAGTWLSPGQWGADSLTALWFLAFGGLVTQRIARWDVSVIFLGAWATLLSTRLVWLGYAWDPGAAIWLQQISNGSTLLFAFFMISDPMTTPQHRVVRQVYVVGVALAAFYWQFVLFKPQGLIVALFASSWTVPVLNALWPQARFAWHRPRERARTPAAAVACAPSR
jgi:enediyne biosynthesis protein E5